MMASMQLPRFRVRTLMIIVAIFALAFAVPGEVARRRAYLWTLSDYHRSQMNAHSVTYVKGDCTYFFPPVEPEQRRLFIYHSILAHKYWDATPWLPVLPGPS